VVYSGVRPQDVAEIVRRHLLQGQVIERLLYRRKEAPPSGADETGPEGEALDRPGS
jgi:(2Fe-2S) ferredoxin